MIRTDMLRVWCPDGRVQDPARHLCLGSHTAPVSGAAISFPGEIVSKSKMDAGPAEFAELHRQVRGPYCARS
jgi:hypothetical protein